MGVIITCGIIFTSILILVCVLVHLCVVGFVLVLLYWFPIVISIIRSHASMLCFFLFSISSSWRNALTHNLTSLSSSWLRVFRLRVLPSYETDKSRSQFWLLLLSLLLSFLCFLWWDCCQFLYFFLVGLLSVSVIYS